MIIDMERRTKIVFLNTIKICFKGKLFKTQKLIIKVRPNAM